MALGPQNTNDRTIEIQGDSLSANILFLPFLANALKKLSVQHCYCHLLNTSQLFQILTEELIF